MLNMDKNIKSLAESLGEFIYANKLCFTFEAYYPLETNNGHEGRNLLAEGNLGVIGFTATEGLSTISQIQIQLACSDPKFNELPEPENALLDQTACLNIYRNGTIERQFYGIVTAFTQKDRGSRTVFYELTLQSSLHRLSLEQDSRIFQGMSLIDITHQIFKEKGIRHYQITMHHEHVIRDFVTMSNETYLEFLMRYWAEEGIIFFFQYTDNRETLILKDNNMLMSAFKMPCTYNANAGGMAAHEGPYLRQLSSTTQIRPTHAALNDYLYRTPSSRLLMRTQTYDKTDFQGRYVHFDYPGRYKIRSVGAHFSRVRIEALRADAQVSTGLSNIPHLRPGVLTKIVDHPTIRANKSWLISRVTHVGTQPQALVHTGNDGMTQYSNTVNFVPFTQQWKPPLHPKKRIYGVQSAVVVGPEGEEIYCDMFNRIMVRYHWDEAGAHTVWLRVSSFAAGSGFGFVSTPRIGQEVLVSFYDDDPDHPIVIGVAFNPRHMTPYPLPKHKTKTVLRTQTHQGEGFNELSFEDEAGKEDIYTRAQKDMHTLVLNDQDAIIKHDKSTLVEHDMRHEVKNNAHYSVEKERRTMIHAEDHHTISERKTVIINNDSITVQGTSHQKYKDKLLIDANEEVHVKVGNKMVLEASSDITLKVGGSFIRIDASGVYIVGPTVNINGGGTAGIGTPANVLEALLPEIKELPYKAVKFEMLKMDARPFDGYEYKIYKSSGEMLAEGKTDKEGYTKDVFIKEGERVYATKQIMRTTELITEDWQSNLDKMFTEGDK